MLIQLTIDYRVNNDVKSFTKQLKIFKKASSRHYEYLK